jgi:DNA-binding transcriptional LysR family regulator
LARHGKPTLRGRLRGHRVVGLDPELRGTVGAHWLAKQGNLGEVALTCNSLISQAAAVVSGLGCGPRPCVFGDREVSLERALPRTIGHHDLWLVVHPDVRQSARVRAVMDYLTELVLGEAALLSGNAKPARPVRTRRGRSLRDQCA